MNKNDLFELEITDMGVDGEGIGKHDGMTFFVKDALIGDVICARVTKLKKNYGYARMEKLLSPSADRVEPSCPLHRRCGGCQIQALSYDSQLKFKQNKVRNNLIRLGGFQPEEIDDIMEPIVGMEEPFRYRNKAQYPVGYDKEHRPVMGFYAARTHSIIPVEDCLLGAECNAPVLRHIRAWMEENRIPAYEETKGSGQMRHILIRYGFTSKEIMVCLIINGDELPCAKDLISRLKQVDGMTSISVNIHKERTNVILGSKTRCIWGQPYITDEIHLREVSPLGKEQAEKEFALTDKAISYHISPQSFYQVNPVQTEKLYSTALSYANLTGQECVWDLYCGIGTISLFLSQKAKQVYGVEIVPQAIADARENARRNGIDNVEFFVGEVEEILPRFYEALNEAENGTENANHSMKHPEVIVVDPPRKGCDIRCLQTMLHMQPERIVYVSCDSATLARDLRILTEGGYAVRRVRAFDQFGHTSHVETACLLTRKVR